MNWNFSQLSLFRAVADAESFTRGAAVIGVSQPAVSKTIAELEKTLGVALIERGSRRATLTPAGALLLEHVQRVDAILDDARLALSDLSALRRGRLRIGATPTIGTYLLPRAVVYFRRRFPDVEVSIAVAATDTLFNRLNDGRLDIVLSPRESAEGRKAARAFMTDLVVPVVAVGHALTQNKTISVEQLADEPMIFRDGPRQTAGYVERMLRSRRCLPSSVLRLPQTESVKQAVLAGLGIAFLPSIAVADDLALGRLKKVAVKGFVLKRSYYWAERELAKRPSVVRAFECVLKHAVRGTLPNTKRS